MIYDLDILLPLDTVSTPSPFIFGFWAYSQKAYFLSVEVLVIYVITLPESRFKICWSTSNTFILVRWENSQKAFFLSVGVLVIYTPREKI